MATIVQNWQDTAKLASQTSKSGDAGGAPAGCRHFMADDTIARPRYARKKE